MFQINYEYVHINVLPHKLKQNFFYSCKKYVFLFLVPHRNLNQSGSQKKKAK